MVEAILRVGALTRASDVQERDLQVEMGDETDSATADATMTVGIRYEAPSAVARRDQEGIEGEATVTLRGSGSDPAAGDSPTYSREPDGRNHRDPVLASAAESNFTAPLH